MIPKYPFQVHVTFGNNGYHRETHNYETLQGATSYAGTALRKPMVRMVQILVILEEHTKPTN